MELFNAAHVMQSPVITLRSRQSLYLLTRLLLDTSYSGFPVVEINQETGDEVVYGHINRSLLVSNNNNKMLSYRRKTALQDVL